MSTSNEENPRSRLNSTDSSLSDTHYPTIVQLTDAPDKEVNSFLKKSNKDYIICRFKELLSQHSQLLHNQKNNDTILNGIKEIKEALTGTTSQDSKVLIRYSDVVRRQINNIPKPETRKPNSDYASEIKISGIPEFQTLDKSKPKRKKILNTKRPTY